MWSIIILEANTTVLQFRQNNYHDFRTPCPPRGTGSALGGSLRVRNECSWQWLRIGGTGPDPVGLWCDEVRSMLKSVVSVSVYLPRAISQLRGGQCRSDLNPTLPLRLLPTHKITWSELTEGRIHWAELTVGRIHCKTFPNRTVFCVWMPKHKHYNARPGPETVFLEQTCLHNYHNENV